ncbi:YdcF family protein [Nocardia alni]|uniref:YdcF family protein n=1 Tax=Nocardia alni TaxID=2815723 RepID=UPI001C216CED|nr:YdcF family protein [Nocardia alni]
MLDVRARTLPSTIPDDSGVARDASESRYSTTGFIFIAVVAVVLPLTLSALGAMDHAVAELLGFGLFVVLSQLSLLTAGIGLLANGVVVVRREGVRVATVVALVAGLGLMVLSMAIRDVVHPEADTPAWLSIAAGVIVVVGAFLLAQLVAFTGYAVLYARSPRRAGSDALIVLGCGLDGARVTPLLASRLDRAAQVYRSERAIGADPVVVTSGGRGPGETVAEADAMADYLVAAGIPASRIIRERESRTTQENLRNSAAEVRGLGSGGRMVVITSDFHVLRAAMLSRRLGLGARVVGGRTARYFVLTAFLREFVAVLALHRRANIAIGTVLIATAVLGYCTVLS